MTAQSPEDIASCFTEDGVVTDDYQGVREILKWLSYVPCAKGGPLPLLMPAPDSGDQATSHPGQPAR